MNFGIPAAHKVKLKEGEKRDKYQDLARESTPPPKKQKKKNKNKKKNKKTNKQTKKHGT